MSDGNINSELLIFISIILYELNLSWANFVHNFFWKSVKVFWLPAFGIIKYSRVLHWFTGKIISNNEFYRDDITRQHYYLQLRKNIADRGGNTDDGEQNVLPLVALGLQADLGDHTAETEISSELLETYLPLKVKFKPSFKSARVFQVFYYKSTFSI